MATASPQHCQKQLNYKGTPLGIHVLASCFPCFATKVLRRSQLALKTDDLEDGTEEGKKGPGRPKAKAKAKAKGKAKAKARAREPKAKARAKNADKDLEKKSSEPERLTPENVEGEAPDAVPNNREEKQDPSAGTKDDTMEKTTEDTKPKKRSRVPKKPSGAMDKEKNSEESGKDDTKEDTDKDGKEDKKKRQRCGEAATFARRPYPSSEFGKAKWSSLRDAFLRIVKPKLVAYSAFEDCSGG